MPTRRQARYEVIPSRVWQGPNGRTVSPYGAAPWTSEAEKPLWKLVEVGFTVRDRVNGTVGIGRRPWATKGEADAWVNA